MRFTLEPMLQIIDTLRAAVAGLRAGECVVFEVLDPDLGGDAYAGTKLRCGEAEYLHRGYRAWTDLAELLGCRMLTPRTASEQTVRLRFQKLDREDSFHAYEGKREEKYGVDSPFFAIDKNEEPAFVNAYAYALINAGIATRRRVLNLGINTGDEFSVIKALRGAETFGTLELVGIDHSASAIAYARDRFPEPNVTFHDADINRLDELGLGRFDLIVSIGTLQSPGVDFKPLFMSLVQHYLSPEGAVILGFPNCRWAGGEMLYGAKAPNYGYSEQSLLYKDVYYCKKYLQQKKFRVTLTGKPYLFLTATRIGMRGGDQA